jgi:hypothetical protein
MMTILLLLSNKLFHTPPIRFPAWALWLDRALLVLTIILIAEVIYLFKSYNPYIIR